ncbi:response regulator [Alteromonas sediminis]|uniref:diguanylate cyclase n=1 Tax=Alteromonas sediminis TaxID=2259342 RepID=A0A3N5ZBE3_9ALTE|nr:response regulator [Alteromonas sediminis]RPJ68604.1 response regulator [Alteromonas sediminis]
MNNILMRWKGMAEQDSIKHEYQSQFTDVIKTWAMLRQNKADDQFTQFRNLIDAFRQWASQTQLDDLIALLDTITTVLPSSPSLMDNGLIGDVDTLLNKLIVASKQPSNPFLVKVQPSPEVLPARAVTRIAIIDDSELARISTKAMLDRFNFDVDVYDSVHKFRASEQAMANTELVLLDVVMPDITEEQLFDFAEELRQKNIKVILVSGSDSVNLRLKAVRAGIGGYVTKPFDINLLVSNIRWICNLDVTKPFHVMLLDNDQAFGDQLRSYATSMDIKITLFNSSESLINALDNGVPDLFLLEVDVPEISGIEVCKILRQQKRFDYVPIVFLSGDDRLETKVDALSAGADDLVIKHNPPDIIFRQMEKRIVRGQRIRSMAVKDSLTGLLNHGQMMDAASSALKLARRNNSSITVAMLDIDNFKNVNDTHGHMVGDNVIVGLAQLLKTSIRDTDVVGRYGGEEFIVVFHSEDLATIQGKLQEILQTFTQLRFNDGDHTFGCSFSCGLATATPNETVKDVINRADQVMYEVKREGKNAVKVA